MWQKATSSGASENGLHVSSQVVGDSTSPRPRGRRAKPLLLLLLATVAFLVFGGVIALSSFLRSDEAAFTGIHRAFNGLELPPAMQLVDEEQTGIAECIGGDCAEVTRVYGAPAPVSDTCPLVLAAVRKWGARELERKRFSPCEVSGSKDGYTLVASVLEANPGIAEGRVSERYDTVAIISLERVR